MKRKSYLVPLIWALGFAILCVLIIADTLLSGEKPHIIPFIGYGGTFYNPNISIFGIELYMLLLLCGIIVSSVIQLKKRVLYGFTSTKAIAISIIFFVIVYLGAKCLFGIECVISAKSFSAWSMNGQSMFGGIYLSIFLVPLLAKIFHINVNKMFNYYVSICPIILGFARIGCFTSGCCGGDILFIGDSPLYLPIQLFEVICDLLILSLCLYMEQKKKFKTNEYCIYPYMVLSYCFVRFLLEYMRNNPVLSLGMTIAQIHCIILSLISLAWLCYQWEQESKKQHKK